eukprot:6016727-Pleurochrysis_carterae.AAC.3
MRLACIVPSVSVPLSVVARRAPGWRRHVAVAREPVVVCATSQRPDLVTAPKGRRWRSGACTGELGI